MFSTTQLDVIAPLVQSMYSEGYIYYVVHTNTNLANSYNNYDYADLTFYFSKKPINCNNYVFTGTDIIKKDVITRNVSNNTSDSKLPRITTTTSNTISFNIPSYEHISTNADNSQFMNHVALIEYANNNDISYNLNLNHYYAIGVLIAAILLFSWLKVWFARNYGGKSYD